MYGDRYFGPRYFGDRYFGRNAAAAVPGAALIAGVNAQGELLLEATYSAGGGSSAPMPSTYDGGYVVFSLSERTTITGFNLDLFKLGAPSGTFVVGIMPAAGSPLAPDGDLDAVLHVTGTWDPTTANTTHGLWWFAVPATLDAGDYAIVLDARSMGGDASNYLAWQLESPDEGYSPRSGTTTDGGTTWSSYATADHIFELYSAASEGHNRRRFVGAWRAR